MMTMLGRSGWTEGEHNCLKGEEKIEFQKVTTTMRVDTR